MTLCPASLQPRVSTVAPCLRTGQPARPGRSLSGVNNKVTGPLLLKHSRARLACWAGSDLQGRWKQGAKDYVGRSAEGILRVAEGGAYGSDQPGGNSFSYWFLAVAFTGAAALAAVAPNIAAELLFGANGRPHDYLQAVLFRLLAVGFLGAATENWVLKLLSVFYNRVFPAVTVVSHAQPAGGSFVHVRGEHSHNKQPSLNAARDGFLDEAIFRRANISLAMLAGTNLFLIASTFIPNPIYPSSPLLPTAALALGAINFNQLWVSGINFVKYSPEGFNTLKIFKGFFRDLTNLTSVSGLNSGIYSALTASFVLAGLTYIGLPTQSLTAIFGTAAEKGLEDIFLWHLIGTAVSMVVGPIAYTQQEAANQNNFSDPSKRTLMTGLAVASAAHVAVFLPLLNTNESGALLFPVGFIWGVSAVASALIAIKPSE